MTTTIQTPIMDTQKIKRNPNITLKESMKPQRKGPREKQRNREL